MPSDPLPDSPLLAHYRAYLSDPTRRGIAADDARLLLRAADGLRARVAAAEAERDVARIERDRLARVLRVEQGDERAAPRGWRARVYGQMGGVEWTRGAWVAVSEGHVVNDVALRRYRLHRGGKDPIRSTRGIFDFALDAMEAADAARKVSDAE